MTSSDFDVIIIGAGPAGTAAAYCLLDNGLSVGLLDRSEFPREKPCAGGLTLKTLALMPYSIAPVIEHVTTGLDIGVMRNGEAHVERFDRGSDICAFAVRSKFDAFNLTKTTERGAQFMLAPRIDHIEERDSHVAIKFDGKTLRSKYLIGADGANSQVRRMAFPESGFYRGFAIEGLIPYSALKSPPHAEFLLGFAESGYGWIFPKRDHANVGVYSNREDVHLSKTLLRDYASARLDTDALNHIKGYPLGFGGERYWQVAGRIVLVGDAGGFAEPLLGEGLHNAVKTGQAAGRAISDLERGRASGSLKARFGTLSKPVRRDVKRCRDIAYRLLYPRLTGLGGAALMHPLSRYALLKGFAAGKTIRSITNGFTFAALMQPRPLSALRDFHRAEKLIDYRSY